MEIYIILFFLLLFASLIPNKFQYFYVAIFLLLIGIAGFRGIEVGVDTYHYGAIFDYISSEGYWPGIEPGWQLLNRVVSYFSGSFLALLTITAFLTLLPVFYISKKCSPYMYMSIFVFYGIHLYSGAFNLMRQYLAISITLLAIYYYIREKEKVALCIWLCACTIHFSCFLAISILLFNKIYMTFPKAIVFIIVAFLFGTIVNQDFVDLITFSEYTHIATSRNNILLAGIFTALLDVFMLFVIYTSPKQLLNSLWGKYFVLSILVFTATFTLHFSARLYSLFAISQIIYFPLYVKYSTLKNKFLAFGIVFIFVSAQFWRMLSANANLIIPYELNHQELQHTFLKYFLI